MIFDPKISSVKLWTNSFAAQITIGRGVEGETPAFWTRPQTDRSTVHFGRGLLGWRWIYMTLLKLNLDCFHFFYQQFIIPLSQTIPLTPKLQYWVGKWRGEFPQDCWVATALIRFLKSSGPQNRSGLPRMWDWEHPIKGPGDKHRWAPAKEAADPCFCLFWFGRLVDFAIAMSIYITNHSKLIHLFSEKRPSAGPLQFQVTPCHQTWNPLSQKCARPHPWRWRTPRGQTAGCLRDALWTVAINFHQQPQKLHCKPYNWKRGHWYHTEFTENRDHPLETCLDQLSWKLIMNRAQCLSQKSYQLHEFSPNPPDPLWLQPTVSTLIAGVVHCCLRQSTVLVCWVASVDVNEAEQAVSQTKFGPGHQPALKRSLSLSHVRRKDRLSYWTQS